MRMLTKIVVRGSSFCTEAMTAQEAKRAFVTVLLALAAVYGLVLNITRDSADTELVTAFKRVARKAHPDKGGTVEDSARLHASRSIVKIATPVKKKISRRHPIFPIVKTYNWCKMKCLGRQNHSGG